MKATKLAFERRYSDDSGIEYAGRVNGIDFSHAGHHFTKPHRVKHTFRIGNRKVPRWLYELTLDMALQISEQARGKPGGAILTRAADGTVSIASADKRPSAKEE